MTPAEEARYLRLRAKGQHRVTPADLLTLAATIETDPHVGRLARLVTAAVLRGRAARMTREGRT